jgi:acetyl esterase/lipase
MTLDAGRPDIPQSLRALMADIGPRWRSDVPGHVKLMVTEFSKLHEPAANPSSRVTADIVYGPHPRQQFDLFQPAAVASDRPLVIFVHGGAFITGHRNRTPQIYANVLHYFARHGIAGINVGYRLAPEAQYPAASQDIASVVRWAHDNAARYGWNARRIFLMGHSAGGAHTGSYAYDKRLHPPAGPGLAGLIVIGGRMRADVLDENPNAAKVAAYYGSDASRLDDCSPVSHIDADSVPTFIAMGEFENPLIDVYCLELAYKLAQAKRCAPPLLWLRGHNHTSMIGHVNTSEDVLGRAIREFIAQPARADPY